MAEELEAIAEVERILAKAGLEYPESEAEQTRCDGDLSFSTVRHHRLGHYCGYVSFPHRPVQREDASRKWHYFDAGSSFSLCGRIGFFFGATEQGNDDSSDNCAECKKRKKHLATT